MTLTELYAYFRTICGGAAQTDAELKVLLNDAQADVTLELGHPRHTETILSIVGQRAYGLPNEALQILRQGGVRYEGELLEYITIDKLDKKYPDWKSADNSTPTHWFQDELDTASVYPEPETVNENIDVTVLIRPDDMSADIDKPFNGINQLISAHKLLVLKVAIDAKDGKGKFLQGREIRLRKYEEMLNIVRRRLQPQRKSVVEYNDV